MVPARLPKLYLVRHGETEWTINGRHTGTSDIPLTANGESIIQRLGEKAAGPGKLIDPHLLSSVLVSPRKRAQKTFELLFNDSEVKPPFQTDERVREWTYGDYEGLYLHEIADLRKKRGLISGGSNWDIWVDGCEDGESVIEMTARVDEVVKFVKKLHFAWANDPVRKQDDQGGDVLIVSHGHFSRCLLARWLGLRLQQGQLFSLDPGGVCVMQYYHDLDHTSIGSMNLGLL
ncbi:phosphoglycerate mutase-like protein [Ramaria rubella]|nr:phosphoglycerate mutase-like protein [Ramaria rubella]KAF8575187.1 phosphoglycerate mutase-like protein [Ramaria rubella]